MSGRSLRTLAVAACAMGLAAPVVAQSGTEPAPGFRQDRTREGCLFFAPASAGSDWSFTWVGSCTPGQVINGQGTLEGRGPQGFTPRMSGQMIGGYLNGPITLVSIYPAVPGRPRMEETQHFQYNMGCNVTWTNCRPPPRPRSVGNAATATVTPSRSATRPSAPATASASPSAAYQTRLVEGQRLASTPAVQRALRNPNRTYDRSMRLTPAERALANRSLRDCQSEFEDAYADFYASRGEAGADPAFVVADLDINILASDARYAADAARGDANAIQALRSSAMREGDGPAAAKRCVSRHHLARLGIPVEDGAAGEASAANDPAGSAAASTSSPRQQEAVDTDEYAARCLRALVPGRDEGAALYGMVVNSCDFRIAYTLCILNARPGSWGESFRCEAGRGTRHLDHVRANGRSSTHTSGGDAVYLFACRDPATPRNAEFQLGRGIIGECR